ncbi:MAG TPA: NAD-dependent epimerase/dehydratase family protein [Thermoanaerobaculia bacterium]|nr:NAD-dependent epimerase/dehydratase family protein [Thermoanaerobaculia bacterium]
MTTRRDFLWKTAASAGLLAGGFPAFSATKKTLLVLGGTNFLGPAIVEAAKASGWTITLFNRGKTRPDLFPDLEKLHGDRNGDLKSLEGRAFDAVVDTSGYFPRQVRDTAALLGKSAKQYVFVSSISVYSDLSKPGVDETGPVAKLKDPTVEKVTAETYGGLKALCEKAAEEAMPGRVTNVRPGLIVGPNDGTDRFTYWPVRVARGGEVLAPDKPEDPVQFIDVRDLGAWIVKTIDTKTMGVFNATSAPLRMGDVLDACKAASGSDARFTWVDAAFLAARKVEEWSDLPVWTSPLGSDAGAGRVSNARAVAKGLAFRPVKITAKDTLDWWKTLPKERTGKMRAGLEADREAAVLAAWHEAQAKKPPKAG